VPPLLEAARRLETVDPVVARATYLEALRAASITGRLGGEVLLRAAEAARTAPPPGDEPRAVDLLLYGLAIRFTDGYAASAAPLKQALVAVRNGDGRSEQDVRWPWLARRVAPDLWDDEAWHAIITRAVQVARDRAALGVLPLDLNNLATLLAFEGDLDAAEALLEESDSIADATGAGRIVFGRLLLTGFRGDEPALSMLVEAGESLAMARSEGVLLTFSEHARALVYNGLGQYEAALAPAASASARDELAISVWALPELVEAATRSGRAALAAAALERLTERTRAAGTEWALGIGARSRALLSEGKTAEKLYREAIERLGRCRVVTELARAHLLYGEWLRREGRRVDARDQLRPAHDSFLAIGMEAFGDRARHELLATGERVRKRSAETLDQLTPQETQIARLASDGRTNPEIGAQLFLSRRTVEWHLRKVFDKLDVRTRRELPEGLRRSTHAATR
jgi:DNA-binding CsgD family transcriptional regulator